VLLGCAGNGNGFAPHSEGATAKTTPAATAKRSRNTSWSAPTNRG